MKPRRAGRKCAICQHKNRVDFDRSILLGESDRQIGTRLGTSKSAINRHRAHVAVAAELATVPPAEIGEQRARAIDLRAEVLWCVSEAKRLGRAAEAGEDLPTALHAVHQVRAVLELLARYARLEQGAQLASQGTSGGMLERFGSATAALAWLREEGLALLEREAAAEGAIA